MCCERSLHMIQKDLMRPRRTRLIWLQSFGPELKPSWVLSVRWGLIVGSNRLRMVSYSYWFELIDYTYYLPNRPYSFYLMDDPLINKFNDLKRLYKSKSTFTEEENHVIKPYWSVKQIKIAVKELLEKRSDTKQLAPPVKSEVINESNALVSLTAKVYWALERPSAHRSKDVRTRHVFLIEWLT